MLIPLRTSSLYNQSPLPNWGIIAANVMVWLGTLAPGDHRWVADMVLDGASLPGLLGHMFLHAGVFHLAGNMIFLWVFGNVVCAKVGPIMYIPVYLLCGIGAAFCHMLATDLPAIGASGAINGIVAFYLVLQPVNEVDMVFIFFLRGKQFTIAGFWVILYWLAWDVYGLLSGGHSRIGFAAHVGGFATGFLLGCLFVYLKLVTMDEYDNPTLLEYLGLLPKGYSAPRRQTKPRPEPAPVYQPPPDRIYHQATEQPRTPIHFPAKPQEPPAPLKPFAERARPESPRMPSDHVQTFSCPHCQTELELDMAALPTSNSLLCPACKGTIDLVFE